tara:strand:+ start:119 stop:550 length:432 start_codon:yes stop_codon:yes gene_type:complete
MPLLNTKKKKALVCVCMAGDILHKGHIKVASTYGKVTVGLLTDSAIESYKGTPALSYEQRYLVMKNMKQVHNVIPQNTLDHTTNLNLIKPKYVVHGDDWKRGVQKKTRLKAINKLKKWSGKLIEPQYTKNISSSLIKIKIKTA